MKPWILLALAACGDNVEGGFSPGARIVPYGDVYEGGVEVPDPTALRDLARDEDCTLQTWSDGATYCTPQTVETVYADPFCRKLVAHTLGGAAGYAKTEFLPPYGDPMISKLRALGDEQASAAYYRPLAGDCVGPMPAEPGARFFAVSDSELTSASFARVTREVEPIDDRLALIRLRGDDGLSIPLGFRDLASEFDCTLEQGQCSPSKPASGQHLFTDEACSVPAAYIEDVVPDAILLDRDDTHRYFAVDGPAQVALWSDLAGRCVPAGQGNVYIAGRELDLAPITRAPVQTEGRFSPIAYGWQPLGVIDSVVFDNTLQIECFALDGWCAPTHPIVPPPALGAAERTLLR